MKYVIQYYINMILCNITSEASGQGSSAAEVLGDGGDPRICYHMYDNRMSCSNIPYYSIA